MSQSPIISVIMAAHNDERYLAQALGSLFAQAFTDFEVLLFDDASTDGTADFLATIRDSRLRITRNARNLGLTQSLNLGLAQARGKYIARMDADDIAHPQRFALQVAYLDSHPSVGILGSDCVNIDDDGRPLQYRRMPVGDRLIRWRCCLENPFIHPSVMIRREVLLRHELMYDPAYRSAQDYELWGRVLAVTEGANLSKPLLQYRIRGGSISEVRRAEQLKNHVNISMGILARFLPEETFTLAEVEALCAFIYNMMPPEQVAQKASSAGVYLDLLRTFAAHYPSTGGSPAFRSREALRALTRVFRNPLPPNWYNTLFAYMRWVISNG